MRSRFEKFIKREKIEKQNIKKKNIIIDESSKNKELILLKKIKFLNNLYASLNESGLKINETTLISILIIYVLSFYIIGANFISNWYFKKLPNKLTINEILSNEEYNELKTGLEIIGMKNLNLNDKFINEVKNDKYIKEIINVDRLYESKINDDEKSEIKKRIDEIKNKIILRYFKNKEQVDNNELLINFSDLETTKESITKKLIEMSKNEKEQKAPTEKDIKVIINKNINSFYQKLKLSFNNFIIQNYSKEIIEKINPYYQKSIFNVSFGIIFTFLGITIFSVYFYKNIAELSLKRMREDLPSWIQMFTNSVQAGYSLEQALEFTVDKVKREPLSKIVKDISVKYKTYKDLKMALEPMKKWENRIPEVKLFISTLIVQQEKGGNIIPVLYSLTKLIIKRDIFAQKVESIASEATGQLKIVFILFSGLILIAEKFFNSNPGFFSPFFSFCSRGGGISGGLYIITFHIFIFFLSYLLFLGSNIIIKKEIKF